MPELPEVETVRSGLADLIDGRVIESVEVLHPRPVRRQPGGAEGFAQALVGQTFTTPRRRGKYLWLPLTGGDAVLAHLGMSGQFRVDARDAPLQRHARVLLNLGSLATAGDERVQLRFVDQRMFGGLSVSSGGAVLPREISHIARDPMDAEFDADAVVSRIRRSASGIKRQLLNQSVVSGIGNIYADEALWRSQVHYATPGQQLSERDVRAVLDAANTVMREALAQGGTSFDALYVNVNGESGYFDRTLAVYGREDLPCSRCGAPVVREPFMNRSAFRCPVCQPAPLR